MAFSRLSVRRRLALIIALSLLGYICLIVVAVVSIQQSLYQSYQTSIRNIVTTGYHALDYFHQQETSGRMTRDQAQAAAKDYLRGLRYGNNDYFNLFDYQVRSVMHPIHPEFEGKDQSHQKDTHGVPFVRLMVTSAANSAERSAFQSTEFPRPGSSAPVAKLQYLRGFDPWQWVIASGVYLDDVDRIFREKLITFLLVSIAGLLAMAALTFFISRSLMQQLGGEPAYAAGLLQEVAAGNLAVDVKVARTGTASMLEALQTSLTSIRTIMTAIGTSAGKVAAHAQAISTSAQSVTHASGTQSDATKAVAAAVEQLSVSIEHISAISLDTEHDSARAVDLAKQGKSKAGEAAAAMQDISETIDTTVLRIDQLVARTDEIGSVAGVIKDIAAQTNLLALNAAIEAARAGEQGRGFAVVADEVRGLAERTANATVEIENMVKTIQVDTRTAVGAIRTAVPLVASGVTLAEEAAQSLEEIHKGTGATLGRVRDVAAATREQSAASQEISRQIEQIASMADSTNKSVNSIAQAVNELESVSAGLNGMVGQFHY
ncbi:methyl-accepting chemotaxis protein [Crenobacter sp. SG2305]|uniref:methyl-accepting chemotaxis protein n=1 Tax=Crenobacter oryzisoli TaxID=3056844 RepID=UPI0025AB2C9B|nr:methyl-accepting chemotaxis protein [Crenobacter sp. SG2305]MDN0083909.1 methyl-accepting chemotaxis protein [Crenobacter sp. SG2305]